MWLSRSVGINLHPTSLPGGRLGPEAYAFVDWLAAAEPNADTVRKNVADAMHEFIDVQTVGIILMLVGGHGPGDHSGFGGRTPFVAVT